MKGPNVAGRWIVWELRRAPCCGINRVHVYPAYLVHIECECGEWIATPEFDPKGEIIPERGKLWNR